MDGNDENPPSTSQFKPLFAHELRFDDELREDHLNGNEQQRFQMRWLWQLEENLLTHHEKYKGKDFVEQKDADRFVEHARRFHTLNRYNFMDGLGSFISVMALGGNMQNYDGFPAVSAAYEGTMRGIVDALYRLQRNVPSEVALRDFLISFREFLDGTDQPKDRQPVMLIKEHFRAASIMSKEEPTPEPYTDDVKFRLPPIRIPPRMGLCLDGIYSLIVDGCIQNCGLDPDLFKTEKGRYCEYLELLHEQGRSRPEDQKSGVKRKHAPDWDASGSDDEVAAGEDVEPPASAVDVNTVGEESQADGKGVMISKAGEITVKEEPN